MKVGIPREVKADEFRVAMTPAGVRELVSKGHEVFVETAAGTGSSISDGEFEAAGGRIIATADELWSLAELVCKVKEPVAEEYPWLSPNQILFTYLHLAASRDCTEALLRAGTTAIAYETLQLDDGSLPLLAPMSEIAGRMSPIVGAEQLQSPRGGRGVLLSGVAGVRPAAVVILGAGVAGSNAAAIAVGMHAQVTVLDLDLGRLRSIDRVYQGHVETIASSAHAVEEACLSADLVIGAVLVVGARAPKLVSDALVSQMRAGSVLVDIAVDQGGCFESTHPTTHSQPTYSVHDSIFYCVANMPGAVPHTSTHALTNATLPYVMKLAAKGWADAARRDRGLARAVNIAQGVVTSAPVAAAHGLSSRPLEELIGEH